MQKRLLIGSCVALLVMLLGSLLTHSFDALLNRSLTTPLGIVPVADLASVLVAMAAGGYAARDARFRWLALGMIAVVWVAALAVLMWMLPPNSVSAAPASAVLQYNGLGIVMSLGVAWLGAVLGARFATGRLARAT